jgi:hypothetical protein
MGMANLFQTTFLLQQLPNYTPGVQESAIGSQADFRERHFHLTETVILCYSWHIVGLAKRR